MASLLEMSCACGYRRLVRTGGLMRTWEEESWWPFYCEKCGVVNVNISKDMFCPDCGGKEITPYGTWPVSQQQDCDLAYVQAWDYRACKVGHLCPHCHNFTLKFEHGYLRFIAD